VILENEPAVRLAAFAGMLLFMMLLELWIPRRKLRFKRLIRWPANLIITLLNTLAVRLLIPVAAVEYASGLETQSAGLLNMINLPDWLTIVIAVVLLDLVIYLQHRVFHRVPVLWRLHRMHHTDNDIDVTTAVRFHPLEIILSAAIKIAAITVLGAPAFAVLLFELILSSGALFNHANISLPTIVDRLLRIMVVTPDMHRVHHSTVRSETDSNFGFNLSIWDRLFGTYIPQPSAGHTGMTIGLQDTQNIKHQRIEQMLALPFSVKQQ
jgi:sterol desaturase/sphingolipid hydroxylase (fatty acid hydroxylase superfamily)